MPTDYNKFSSEKFREELKTFEDNTVTGPMYEDVLVIDEPEQTPAPKEPVAATVNVGKLNVRSIAHTTGNILAIIDRGTELLVEDLCGDWAYVHTAYGISGFVMTKYIKM